MPGFHAEGAESRKMGAERDSRDHPAPEGERPQLDQQVASAYFRDRNTQVLALAHLQVQMKR